MKQEEISLEQRGTMLFHNGLILAMIVFIVAMVISKTSNLFMVIAFGVWVVLHLIDFILYSNNYMNNTKLLALMRLLQMIAVAAMFIGVRNISYLQILVVVIYLLYYIEYIMLTPYKTNFYRSIALIILYIPFIAALLVCVFLSKKTADIFILVISMSIVGMVLGRLMRALFHYTEEKEDKISSLNNEIADLQEQHKALEEHQDKIKRAIELLGVQKIELSSANKMINKQNSETIVQNEVLRYISENMDMPELLHQMTKVLLKKEGIVAAGVLVDKDAYMNNKRVFEFSTKEGDSLKQNLMLHAEDLFHDVLLKEGKYQVDNYINTSKYPYLKPGELSSVLLMPIMMEGVISGYFMVGSNKKNYFEEDLSFYEAIVAQIDIAVNNAKLYAQMKFMATRDGLTGIYNRRHFTMMFNESVATAMSEKMNISVALFDIDKFKNVNDTYGHTFGDEVIKCVARCGNKVADKYDGFIGRYGGEEFVIVFLGKTIEETKPMMQELQDAIKGSELIHNGVRVNVNVSIGLTEYPKLCMNPGDLLNHADWAMYYSKLNGRGKIIIDSEEVRAASIK